MWLDGKMIVFSGSYLLNDYANMKQSITVRQKVEALDEQIIPLINEGMFLEWEIHIDDIDFYLSISYSTNDMEPYEVHLVGNSEFFDDYCLVASPCRPEDIVEYITEFRSNPHQFVETYGN